MKLVVRALGGAILGGAAAWFSYEWLLSFVYPFHGEALASQSIHQAFFHKFIFALSVSFLGVLIGIYSRKSLKVLLALIVASGVAMIFWLLFIRYRMEGLYKNIQNSTDVAIVKINIISIPLYEIGLFSIFVVLCLMAGLSLKNRN